MIVTAGLPQYTNQRITETKFEDLRNWGLRLTPQPVLRQVNKGSWKIN